MKTNTGFKIGNRWVGDSHPVFIIAEVGVNHNGSISMAKKLIDVAKASGADAVKFQMCDPAEMVVRDAPKAQYQEKRAKGESHYGMLERLFFGVKEHKILKAYAKKKGIIMFSTPFSILDAKRLIALKMPAIKVGSSDTNNFPQLRVIAKSGLPIILSTGMSTLAEVKSSLKEIYKAGNKKVVVLHCTTQYPAEDKNINLRAMAAMGKALGVPMGYSDHTPGLEISLAAAALGATVIEKHITLDRNLPGPDHFASLEPRELNSLVSGIRHIEVALGSDKKVLTPDEKIIARVARKSIMAARNLPVGKKLTMNDFSFKRPGTGLPPPMADKLVGKRLRRTLKKDEMFKTSFVK